MTFLNIQIYAKQEKEVEIVETFAFVIANFKFVITSCFVSLGHF